MTLPFPELENIPADKVTGYYNTTGESGADLILLRGKAAKQDAVILTMFEQRGPLTPWQLHRLLHGRWPITSIRRSVNTLTERGALVKTDEKRAGLYGRNEYVWRVK